MAQAWSVPDLPLELIAKVAAYVADSTLPAFCSVSPAYMIGASGTVSARVLELARSSKDVKPGDNNPAWTNGFEPPPAVVCRRLPTIVRVDLTTASLDKIGPGCFKDCTQLKSVLLPLGLKHVGIRAFSGCFALEAADLPSGLKIIDGDAFCCCKSLRTISLPSSVTIVYDGAFSGCESLESVMLSEGLERLTGTTFYDCTSLLTVTLPTSLVQLGSMVFCGCRALRDVTFAAPSKVKEIGGHAFMLLKLASRSWHGV